VPWESENQWLLVGETVNRSIAELSVSKRAIPSLLMGRGKVDSVSFVQLRNDRLPSLVIRHCRRKVTDSIHEGARPKSLASLGKMRCARVKQRGSGAPHVKATRESLGVQVVRAVVG
jgi:hypothetical protein